MTENKFELLKKAILMVEQKNLILTSTFLMQ
jgi:hypothetical protein